MGEPGDVAAGASEAFGKTECDWIGHYREYNRNGPGFLHKRGDRGRVGRNDHVRRQSEQFCDMGLVSIRISSTEANNHFNVAALNPSVRLESLLKRRETRPCLRIIASPIQPADPLLPTRLLRPRTERPRGRRAAEQRDEIAPPHARILPV
jgi:hypothetical protein